MHHALIKQMAASKATCECKGCGHDCMLQNLLVDYIDCIRLSLITAKNVSLRYKSNTIQYNVQKGILIYV